MQIIISCNGEDAFIADSINGAAKLSGICRDTISRRLNKKYICQRINKKTKGLLFRLGGHP